jgi:hypothetical protein
MSLEMKYFVLKPKAKTKDDPYAAASQAAMEIYADHIRQTDPLLAQGLIRWMGREAVAQQLLEEKQ